jgi:hypothetical protein
MRCWPSIDQYLGVARRITSERGSDVVIVGWIAVVIVALIVLAALVAILGSIPDVGRYLRIRRM